jgi:UDP-3-O-[3-hydroxymyristoyl] glucosamine N-acyltransferase
MKLSDLPAEIELSIVRDGAFRNLGFLEDGQPAKLVFVESRSLLENLRQDEGVDCAITTPDLVEQVDLQRGIAFSPDPRLSFALIHNYLAEKTDFYGSPLPNSIDASAVIHHRATIAENSVKIGPRCKIGPNAWIGEGVSLGSDVIIHPGAILGGHGLQVVTSSEMTLDLMHAGRLVVGDRVVVMANVVVSKALFRESTRIGQDSRIGNLAFVSHNVQVGAGTIIGHHSVVNGNVVIGEAAWIGPNATISNNLTLGDRSKVSLGATVIRDIEEGQRATGVFAVEHNRMLRHLATFSGPVTRQKDDSKPQ